VSLERFRLIGYTSRSMTDIDTLLEQALSLPEPERARMAARLLESLDEEAQNDVDTAWAAEIERRCAAVDAGTLATSDWKDVRARIERELFGR
jgi:putative addiction module component (TIGR02574 family)